MERQTKLIVFFLFREEVVGLYNQNDDIVDELILYPLQRVPTFLQTFGCESSLVCKITKAVEKFCQSN